ncbi:MAG TPA: M28 family peptidase [Gaiellaceae bacterium]|nr:M28 family peptidase [Gaiellaceae bacterium]
MLARLAACVCAAALLTAAPAAKVDTAGLRAQQTVRALAVLGPRVAGSPTERRAARVVTERFAKLGLTPIVQNVPLPRGGASRNLVFRSGGRPLRAIVLAHLDGVSAGPAANDNGSGVGALLEVARELGETKGVLFAALGAEERVMTGSSLHLGSARLLKSLAPAERRSVRLALSLDMVGYGPELNVRGLERRPNHSAQRALAAARRLGIRATYLRDRGQSDHEELTRGGVPAAWIEWRWDPCWHTACDRTGRVEPAKLAAAIRLTVNAVRAAT